MSTSPKFHVGQRVSVTVDPLYGKEGVIAALRQCADGNYLFFVRMDHVFKDGDPYPFTEEELVSGGAIVVQGSPITSATIH